MIIKLLSIDDVLSCFQNLSGRESEKIKKKAWVQKAWVYHCRITVECNLRIADFLDMTFDLQT